MLRSAQGKPLERGTQEEIVTDAIDDFNQQAYENWDSQSLVPCHNCKRTFRQDALEKHQKGCATISRKMKA